MSLVFTPFGPVTGLGRREQRAELRRLRRQDTLSRQLAELHAIRAVLEQAAELVSHGWVQGAWFSVSTGAGAQQVTAYHLGLVEEHPVNGACLVGAVVQGAGGVANARSQLVQRTLDVVWHALREDLERPVRWCPGPPRRTMHLLDLTRWNDAPGRAREDVVGLLLAAREPTERHGELLRAGSGLRPRLQHG